MEAGTLAVIAMWLIGRKLLDETLDALSKEIAEAVRRNLRGRLHGNPRRKVAIVDENGRTLKTVDVPREDGEAD